MDLLIHLDIRNTGSGFMEVRDLGCGLSSSEGGTLRTAKIREKNGTERYLCLMVKQTPGKG